MDEWTEERGGREGASEERERRMKGEGKEIKIWEETDTDVGLGFVQVSAVHSTLFFRLFKSFQV